MLSTSRKVEVLAAALYAGSFVVWTLGDYYKRRVPEWEQSFPNSPIAHLNPMLAGLEGWEAAALVLLLLAVALTVAAVRLRGAPENS